MGGYTQYGPRGDTGEKYLTALFFNKNFQWTIMVLSEINAESLKHYLDVYFFCQKKDTAILNSYTNIGNVRVCVGRDILNLK